MNNEIYDYLKRQRGLGSPVTQADINKIAYPSLLAEAETKANNYYRNKEFERADRDYGLAQQEFGLRREAQASDMTYRNEVLDMQAEALKQQKKANAVKGITELGLLLGWSIKPKA